jgi:hypothetical protein
MKFRLDTSQMASDFFDDARILGIVAPVKDYQFCWQLNHSLRFDFRVNNDLEIQLNKKERTYYFSSYEYADPIGSLKHYLYNNQFDGEYLLPEFKHLDFLWLLKGDDVKEADWLSLQQGIKSISGVQLVMELASSSIRNKQHLIF